jgi:class 3 adenylate cyclase/rubredoxin
MTNLAASLFCATDLVLVSVLFLFKRTAVWALLLNSFIAFVGIILMTDFAFVATYAGTIKTSPLREPISWLLQTTFPDIAILIVDFSVGLALYRVMMAEPSDTPRWICTSCGWIYDPAWGDPESGIRPGTAFEDLPVSWVCPICGRGKEAFELEGRMARFNHEKERPSVEDQAQGQLTVGTAIYKERFENVFRVAKTLTSSLNIGEVLEMIRDEARASLPQLQEACLLVTDPEAQYYTRPLHCAVEKQRINCQLCKRGRGAVESVLAGTSSSVCFLPSDQSGRLLKDGLPPEGCSEIVFPINEGDRPLGVLDAIARPGMSLDEKDLVLLKDLVQLASNVIVNARRHWKMSQEKLTVDRILHHLRPFVPSTVQKIVEKDPEAPELEKRDIDVTVLFLDIGGYSRISETQSTDKLSFLIEKYFSSFLDIIYVHGGDINETAGDGLMVIFQGQPQETALSAVKAALEIRDKTLEINEELRNRFLPVEVNMGINSGMASVGMSRFTGISGTRMTFTATGPVTNVAARIASAASSGDILVGPETVLRVREGMVIFDRGLMNFKNMQEPVQVFSLVRDRDSQEGDKTDLG